MTEYGDTTENKQWLMIEYFMFITDLKIKIIDLLYQIKNKLTVYNASKNNSGIIGKQT